MTNRKIRITLDLTQQFYERLGELEALVEAGSKAEVIREALRLYEFVARQALEGCKFVVKKNGEEETIRFLGAPMTDIEVAKN